MNMNEEQEKAVDTLTMCLFAALIILNIVYFCQQWDYIQTSMHQPYQPYKGPVAIVSEYGDTPFIIDPDGTD